MQTEPTEDDAEQAALDAQIEAEIGDPVRLPFAAAVVYIPILVVSFTVALLFLPSIPGKAADPLQALTDLGLGLGVGLFVVAMSQLLTHCLTAFKELETEFGQALGDLTNREIVKLALLSGLAEECLFRGCFQPWIGYLATSILFAAVHVVLVRRVFLPWTLFALGSGFLIGGLYELRQSLVAPIVAHVLINGLNIHIIVRRTRSAS